MQRVTNHELMLTANIICKQGLRFCVSLLFSCLIFPVGTHAQKGRFDAKKFRKQQQAFEDKAGGRFRQPSPWYGEDSALIDTRKLDGPYVVFLGYYGCAPCRVLMKSLDTVLQPGAYTDVTFVYMTMDGTESIHQEFAPLKNLHRMRKVVVTRDYINEHELARGFPAIYFVNRNHIISYFRTGGPAQHGPEVSEWWHQHLDDLR